MRLGLWFRLRCRRCCHKFQNGPTYAMHRGYEAVSKARQCFYITRLICRIAERLPELIDGRVKAMFEVTSGSSGPKAIAKIFARHHVGGPLHHRAQNLAWL